VMIENQKARSSSGAGLETNTTGRSGRAINTAPD